MKISKQGVLGATMLVGGSIMLFAITQQPEPASKKAETAQTKTEVQQKEEVDLVEVADENKELTTDIETEKNILEEKQEEREDAVKAQEEKSKDFLENQEKTAGDETKKSDVTAENKAEKAEIKSEEKAKTAETSKEKAEEVKAESKPVAKVAEKTETKAEVKAKPKAEETAKVADKAEKKAEPVKTVKKSEKRPTSYKVKAGDSLLKIAKENGVSLSVLAEANKMHYSANLMAGQNLVIPSKAEVAKLQKIVKRKQAERSAKIKAQKAEAKRQAELKAKQEKAKQTKKAEPKPAKATDKAENKGTFGVQITLASNQEEADKVVAKLRKAGYKAKTSKTDKGVRVIVGPKRGKKEALALKDKINKDSRVNVKDSWVLVWR